VFNIGNYLGTVTAGLVQWPHGTSVNAQFTLLLLVFLRLICVPLIMLCNLAPTDRDLPVLIDSDIGFVLLMSIFSLSDGYIVNMTLMFGPKAGKEEHQEL
jgi:hypothetical protein